MSAKSPEAKERARVYQREYMRRKRAEEPEKVRAVTRRWVAKNPEKAKRVHRESMQRWRDSDRAKAREYNRRYRGLPLPTRPEPPTCECCKEAPGKRGLVLDHDHITGKFRGWLCHLCNCGIGHFKDHPERLLAAALYVEANK